MSPVFQIYVIRSTKIWNIIKVTFPLVTIVAGGSVLIPFPRSLASPWTGSRSGVSTITWKSCYCMHRVPSYTHYSTVVVDCTIWQAKANISYYNSVLYKYVWLCLKNPYYENMANKQISQKSQNSELEIVINIQYLVSILVLGSQSFQKSDISLNWIQKEYIHDYMRN